MTEDPDAYMRFGQAAIRAAEQARPSRVICDDRASQCRCFKDAGHVEAGDPVHECDPSRCTGAWTQDPFTIVRLPYSDDPRPWEIP